VNITEISKHAAKRKKTKRVGRGNGSGRGTYSTRGCKGQKARKGKKLRPGFEGGQTPLVQRMPKLRGFKSLRTPYQVVNVGDLEIFDNGTTIDAKVLAKKGLVRPKSTVKILGDGELKKKLTIQIEAVSKSAKNKIEKAGGKIEMPKKEEKAPPKPVDKKKKK